MPPTPAKNQACVKRKIHTVDETIPGCDGTPKKRRHIPGLAAIRNGLRPVPSSRCDKTLRTAASEAINLIVSFFPHVPSAPPQYPHSRHTNLLCLARSLRAELGSFSLTALRGTHTSRPCDSQTAFVSRVGAS